jgi:hypothetical protein
MPEQIHESTSGDTVAVLAEGSGRMQIQVITPGWGSSGYYSPAVVEAAAPLVEVGTQMFLDHPTEDEATARPERSVRDIAAVVTEAGRWDEGLQAVVAEARVAAPYRALMADVDFVHAIGLSIRGSATDVTEGEAEGRRGRIIEGLARIDSVDFVTRAGRGGRVLQLLESARTNGRALEHDGVTEATVNDTREALQRVLRDAYAGDRTYVWVRDFDATTVWFEVSEAGDESLYGQTYETTAGGVSLTGDRVEVRAVTTYVPVNPAGQSTTQESEEDTMPNIEESRLRELEEAHGRVPTLESERDTAIRERDEARGRLASRDRIDRARAIIAERATTHQVTFTALEQRGLLAGLPQTQEGALDETAFTTAVDEAATEKKPKGGVRGFGGSGPQLGESSTTTSLDDIDRALGLSKEA